MPPTVKLAKIEKLNQAKNKVEFCYDIIMVLIDIYIINMYHCFRCEKRRCGIMVARKLPKL